MKRRPINEPTWKVAIRSLMWIPILIVLLGPAWPAIIFSHPW